MANSNNSPVRIYKCKDSVMLTALATIVENLKRNQSELVKKRSAWTNAYFTTLEGRISNAFQTYLGVNSAKDMVQATEVVHTLQNDALDKLYECQLQIKQDFKKDATRRDQLLQLLGFTSYYKDASRNLSQDALIDLLFTFKQNATTAIQAELTGKNMEQSQISAIIALADQFKNSNITQETFKNAKGEITAEGILALNDLYLDVTATGQTAAGFMRKQKSIKVGFSFTNLVKAQRAALKAAKDKPTSPPTNTDTSAKAPE